MPSYRLWICRNIPHKSNRIRKHLGWITWIKITFIANATVVVRSFAVFLQVVCHVGGPQELATNFAGNFVLMTCEMRPEAVSCSEGGITNLKHRKACKYTFIPFHSLKLSSERFFHTKTKCWNMRVTWHLWGLSVVWTCLMCPFRWSGLQRTTDFHYLYLAS